MGKNILVMASTFPRWKDDSTPSFVLDLCKGISGRYAIYVLAPHFNNSKKEESIGVRKNSIYENPGEQEDILWKK